MSTRKTSRQRLPRIAVRRRRQVVVAISVALSLIGACALLASSGALDSGLKKERPVSPASFNSNNPSKEMIYGPGGRLLATEEPTSSCAYSIAPTNATFTSAGGTGSVTVTTGTACAWTAVSNQTWLTITSGASGSGNGTVNYSVIANSGTARSGAITIAGQTFSVDQAGSICSYSIAPTSASFSASGGSGSVSVTAGAGCSWSAVSNNSWITITSGSSGSGNGTVNYSVAANGGGARNGAMTIAGQTFAVSQAAIGCSYSISPLTQNFSAAGGASSVNVTAGVGCAWAANSNAAWITITAGSSGSGNGSVSYSVAANTGSGRSGSMTIASQTFTVTQNGASCSYSISPPSASFPPSGGPGSTNVTAGVGCQWTATSNNSWITITSGSSGAGNGSVGYSVAANTGAARTGTLTIAAQTFTVNQSASGAPPAPTNLTATALTSTSIRLNWSFVEDGTSFFKIERKTGAGGTYSQIASTNQGARTYTNTKLITHTPYCYRIRAFNGQDGPYSNEACATTP